MTARISAFTVILEDDIRDDCVDSTVNALRMVKGVASVEPHVADYAEAVARSRRDTAWKKALYRFVMDGPE